MSSTSIELPLDSIAELCRAFDVRELAVFGSANSGNIRADSDIDFLVVFNEPNAIGLFQYLELQEKLSVLLHRNVDLVSKRGLKPLIRDEVIASSTIIYASN
jgi:predicted nucleotidyltransferase